MNVLERMRMRGDLRVELTVTDNEANVSVFSTSLFTDDLDIFNSEGDVSITLKHTQKE